ncbi:acyltransferase [Loigolactobacillus bifermentans]|uniref:Acyltransferase 3 domain-containing protein n=1 Tax=Loigolactobacillus bifermentans DSM 20003 TaxID=1423726 RepID=A0A0R1GYH3_9LACO|nr:acyltransferase [Loigolactobacillus bifermentans]KRK39232.1 hypothetical protein FC07_GL002480 [Loigolactobacillus bifermentans DSM 20003]QGG61459.1 acyltransferase family protein [Loigolactobacillus bifermentans]
MKDKLIGRQSGLDLLRFFAIGCVVVSHALPEKVKFLKLSISEQWFNAAMIAIGHFGVPIFFIISGYFLLDRNYDSSTAIKTFYLRRFIPMLLTFETWVLGYSVFLKFWLHRRLDPLQIFLDMTFISQQGRVGIGNYFWNYWFIPAILGLYLAVPFVARAVKQFPRKVLWGIYLLVVSQTMLIPTVNLFFNAQGKTGFSVSQLDLSYFGALSATYFFAGYLLKTAQHKLPVWLVLPGTLVLSGIIVATQYFFQFTDYTHFNGGQLNMPYEYILLLPCGLGLVYLATKISLHFYWLRFIVYRLAQLSMGVFLVHRFFSLILIRIHFLQHETATIQTVETWCVLMVLSYLVVYVISKLPGINRWLLLGR